MNINSASFLAKKAYKHYLTTVISNGGSISAGTETAILDFFETLYGYGLWDYISEMGGFCGDQLAAALVKFKTIRGVQTVLTNSAFVAGDYVERGAGGGLRNTGGTKCCKTGFIPSLLSPSDRHLSVYETTIFGSNSYGTSIGADGGVNTACFTLGTQPSASAAYVYEPGNGRSSASYSPRDSTGFYTGTTLGSAVTLYYNASVKATTSLAAQANTQEIYLFCLGRSGSGADGAGGLTLGFYSIGLSLTAIQVNNFNLAVRAFNSALGR